VIAPIIGRRTGVQLEDALKVLKMGLDAETAAALDRIVPSGSTAADFHNTSGWMKAKLDFGEIGFLR